MILFTSVTKKTFTKGTAIYLGLAIFCIVFTYVYELFSYGESSPYMRLMFLAPLLGAVILLIGRLGMTWIGNRFSLLLFNSSVAIAVSGCLIKGIIEVSGRTTTYEQPYWYVAIAFLILSLIIGFVRSSDSKPTQRRRVHS